MAAVRLEDPGVAEEALLAATHAYNAALSHRLETPRDGSEASSAATLEFFHANYTLICAAAKAGLQWCNCRQDVRLARDRYRNMNEKQRERLTWTQREALEHSSLCDRHLHVWFYWEMHHEEDFKNFTKIVGRSGTAASTAGIGYILDWAESNGWPELDISAAISDLEERPAGIPPVMAIASGERAWRSLFGSLPRAWGVVVELVETTIRGGHNGHDSSRRHAVGIRAVSR